MAKTNIIKYIIENTGLRQKDIADHLGVSGAQVSKWKSGEPINYEKAKVLTELAGLFTENVEWVALVKTKENAEAWCDYIHLLNEGVDRPSALLDDDPDIYAPNILLQLAEAGIPIPAKPPSIDPRNSEETLGVLGDFLYEVLNKYGKYALWYEMYLMPVEDLDSVSVFADFDHYAIPLALGHIDEDIEEVGADLNRCALYVKTMQEEASSEIRKLCRALVRAGHPLLEDYFAYVTDSPDDLEDMCKSSENEIENYLSYGERRVLAENILIQESLKKLHKKIDALSVKLEG